MISSSPEGSFDLDFLLKNSVFFLRVSKKLFKIIAKSDEDERKNNFQEEE